MKRYAQAVMRTQLVTVRPEMQCEEVIDLFLTHHISGAPVVDAKGLLVGVISMTDILRSGQAYTSIEKGLEDERLNRLIAEEGLHIESIPGGFVSDFMNPAVLTATPDTTVEELARMMVCCHIHRIIIVQPNTQEPVGIVTTTDLLKLIASAESPEKSDDQCYCTWYERKFNQKTRYQTLPALQ